MFPDEFLSGINIKAARSASVSRQSAADGLRGTIRITVHAVRHSFPAFAGCLPECHAFYLTPISRNCQRGISARNQKMVLHTIFCLACALWKSYKRHADAFATAVFGGNFRESDEFAEEFCFSYGFFTKYQYNRVRNPA